MAWGGAVEVVKGGAEVARGGAEMVGGGAEMVGRAAEMVGRGVEVVGGPPEVVGGGAEVAAADDEEEIRGASLLLIYITGRGPGTTLGLTTDAILAARYCPGAGLTEASPGRFGCRIRVLLISLTVQDATSAREGESIAIRIASKEGEIAPSGTLPCLICALKSRMCLIFRSDEIFSSLTTTSRSWACFSILLLTTKKAKVIKVRRWNSKVYGSLTMVMM